MTKYIWTNPQCWVELQNRENNKLNDICQTYTTQTLVNESLQTVEDST